MTIHFPTNCPVCDEPFTQENEPEYCLRCNEPCCNKCSGLRTGCSHCNRVWATIVSGKKLLRQVKREMRVKP